LINSYIAYEKVLGNKVTFQNLSDQMRIQKSYLSKVMSRNASISKDQGYLLAKFIGLKPEEVEYLFLLIDYEKCALKELRDDLLHKIKTIQISKTQSDQYLEKESNELTSADIQKYYLLPENQLIHLALSIKKYQVNIEKLRDDFNLNQESFSISLKILEQLNLIEINENEVKLLKSNLHLSPDSPFFHQWKAQMMMKSIEWVKTLETKDKYNFTVSFTSDEKTKETIRIEFLNFLKKVEKHVSKAPSESLYQLNFDLFKWL
jgi:DNA-binding MarR family transcriptional regulator